MILEMICVMGLKRKPKQVLVNGNSTEFSIDGHVNAKTLYVQVNADLLAPLSIIWE